jgi:hypothetical protein
MPIPIMAAAAAGSGLVKALGGVFGSRKRKKEQRAAKKQVQKYTNEYKALDTSNLYAGQQNTYEDLTVNLQEAEFKSEQQNQGLANILDKNQQAAGGSGIAALAQALANQQSQNMAQSAISIGQQEQKNMLMQAQEASRLQGAEIAGAVAGRELEYEKTETLLGMSQQRLAGANKAREDAKQALIGGIGDIAGGALMGAAANPGMFNNKNLKSVDAGVRQDLVSEKPMGWPQ